MSRIICRQIRHSSTKGQRNAEIIKNFNYENKALFGAVKKRERDNAETPTNTTAPDSVKSSEMYWLLQHNSRSKHPEYVSDSNSSLKEDTGKGKPLMSIGDSLKILRSNISRPPTAQEETSTRLATPSICPVDIPFTGKDLKAILRYPLIASPGQPALLENTVTFESRYPSVGKILQATMSNAARKALMKWKLEKIKELGEEGFNELQQTQLNQGKMFHKTLETYFSTGAVPDDDAEGYKVWQSITPALVTLHPKVQLTEKMVEHPALKYRGIVDCVSTISCETAIIEWKKSDKLKTTISATYDAPLQLCAYLGALNADPNYKLTATKGFVVVAYTGGEPAQIHQLNADALKKYWQLWLKRVQEYWIRTRDGTLPEPI